MQEEYDVVIIGAGAAGLMCAIEAGKRGRSVLLIEHTEKIGKKILISGGGRCNFTNINAAPQHYISENPHFCKSALARYRPQDFIALVEQYGIAYHEKKLGQLFCNDSSRFIVQMLYDECKRTQGKAGNGVNIRTGTSVYSADKTKHERFILQTVPTEHLKGYQPQQRGYCTILCNSLVIASGGLSIPKMGATNFGYRLAQHFGLRCTPIKPALVPLLFRPNSIEAAFCTISGVSTDVIVECNGATFREYMLFTHRGLSGPAMLQASSYWNEHDPIIINLMPECSAEMLWHEHRSSPAHVKNILAQYLPKRAIEVLSEYYMADLASIPFSQLSRQQWDALFGSLLSAWRIVPAGTEGYGKAEVTAGGVDTRDVSSKTMEARTVKGLYFIGEVLDVTGWLGGYNFQWAWASGFAAGQVV